jgi:hypothetical protein
VGGRAAKKHGAKEAIFEVSEPITQHADKP